MTWFQSSYIWKEGKSKIFLARTGNQVTDVVNVVLGRDGRLYELDDNSPGPGRVSRSDVKADGIQCVRITFSKDGKGKICIRQRGGGH